MYSTRRDYVPLREQMYTLGTPMGYEPLFMRYECATTCYEPCYEPCYDSLRATNQQFFFISKYVFILICFKFSGSLLNTLASLEYGRSDNL